MTIANQEWEAPDKETSFAYEKKYWDVAEKMLESIDNARGNEINAEYYRNISPAELQYMLRKACEDGGVHICGEGS